MSDPVECPKCSMLHPTVLHVSVCKGAVLPAPKPTKIKFLLVNGGNLTVHSKYGLEILNEPHGLIFFKMDSPSGETVYVNPDHVVSAVLEDDEA